MSAILAVLSFSFQHLTIQVEDVRIKPILSSYRKRIPVTEGYVEVKDGGKWKQICNEEWSPRNSRVICGMFGFPAEKKYSIRIYRSVCSASHYRSTRSPSPFHSPYHQSTIPPNTNPHHHSSVSITFHNFYSFYNVSITHNIFIFHSIPITIPQFSITILQGLDHHSTISIINPQSL